MRRGQAVSWQVVEAWRPADAAHSPVLATFGNDTGAGSSGGDIPPSCWRLLHGLLRRWRLGRALGLLLRLLAGCREGRQRAGAPLLSFCGWEAGGSRLDHARRERGLWRHGQRAAPCGRCETGPVGARSHSLPATQMKLCLLTTSGSPQEGIFVQVRGGGAWRAERTHTAVLRLTR